MRGKVAISQNCSDAHGITPAYAGKRQVFWCCCSNFWDHPRLCGEKMSSDVMSFMLLGSPPPMRGKGTGLMYRGCGDGITPAYAGKSMAIIP